MAASKPLVKLSYDITIRRSTVRPDIYFVQCPGEAHPHLVFGGARAAAKLAERWVAVRVNRAEKGGRMAMAVTRITWDGCEPPVAEEG